MIRIFLLACVTTLGGPALAPPVLALTPPLPCTGVYESDMHVYDVTPLGGHDYAAGVVVENYSVRQIVVNSVLVGAPPPVPDLAGFSGARAVHCASGTFFAVPRTDAGEAAMTLAATEFLRPQVLAGEQVTVDALRRAVRALYPEAIELRETEQTCGCDWFFPDLRPAGQTPFGERTDVAIE